LEEFELLRASEEARRVGSAFFGVEDVGAMVRDDIGPYHTREYIVAIPGLGKGL
jgi:hypothetical protein